MDGLFLHSMTVFMAFFAIMNPLANVPIFLSLTGDADQQTTRAVAMRSLLLAFVIIAVFSIAGKILFQMFGITLPAFRITGGLLVFSIGYNMLQGSHSSVHQLNEGDNAKCREAALSVAVSPLAMPILAGPGTIATAMSFSAKGGFLEVSNTIAAFAVMCIITYICFVSGKRLVALIGTGALGVITRMMGLILAVIGMQMIIEGIQGAIKLAS
jgi:multiple antibiotic resistance protein